MLLGGHQLDDIVSKFLDAGEYTSGKFLISADSAFRGAYTNMGLIYPHGRWLLWPGILEDILLWRVPEDSVVNRAHREVLSDTLDPSGQTFNSALNWDHE